MTCKYTKTHPYFVIAIIHTEYPNKLKTIYKRFVKKYLSDLADADRGLGRMFKSSKFEELKGASFSPKLKREFVSYFCRTNTLELFYIVLDNNAINKNGHLYDNTARAFNYAMRLALEYFINHNYLSDGQYFIQLDERNERPDSKHFLQTYLNTEFRMCNVMSQDVWVRYFNSSENRIVQLADVFANLYYSHLLTGAYKQELRIMQDNKCLKSIFHFPL